MKEFRDASARYRRETDAAVSEEKEEKIRLLLQHYRIADRDMKALALALAAAHVPGFQVIVAGGQKTGAKNSIARAMKLEEKKAKAKKLAGLSERPR